MTIVYKNTPFHPDLYRLNLFARGFNIKNEKYINNIISLGVIYKKFLDLGQQFILINISKNPKIITRIEADKSVFDNLNSNLTKSIIPPKILMNNIEVFGNIDLKNIEFMDNINLIHPPMSWNIQDSEKYYKENVICNNKIVKTNFISNTYPYHFKNDNDPLQTLQTYKSNDNEIISFSNYNKTDMNPDKSNDYRNPLIDYTNYDPNDERNQDLEMTPEQHELVRQAIATAKKEVNENIKEGVYGTYEQISKVINDPRYN